MITEKDIDKRQWIGIRQASTQLNCTVKDIRGLIRQNKWKTRRTAVNNRRRVYLQKSDIKDHLKNSLVPAPRTTINPRQEPLDANLFKSKALAVFVENYQKVNKSNLQLTKTNYLLKVCLIGVCVLFSFFVLIQFSHMKEIEKSDKAKTNKIESLYDKIDMLQGQLRANLQSQLVEALNKIVEPNLNDNFTFGQETKILPR